MKLKTILADPAQRDVWLARAYYFTFFGGYGFILPFINLYYVSVGLSGKQIGTMASVNAVLGLVASPLWVSLARRTHQPRRMMQFGLAMMSLGYVLIGQQTAFWPILGLILFQTLTAVGVVPLSDSMAVSAAQEGNTGYGSIRVWASFSWIMVVLAAGWLIEHFGYRLGFFGTCVGMTIAAGILFLIRPHHFAARLPGDQPRARLRDAVQRVLKDKPLLALAVALIFVTFMNSGVQQFENVFLSQMGASKQLISVAGILSAIVELPFMLFADRILHRYGAHRLVMIAFGMNLIFRLTVLSFPAIATIMVVRFIGGISFSLYTVAFIGLISARTAAAERGTVLALFTGTLAGSVNIVASPIMGALFDAIGTRWLYAFSAAGYLIAFISLWVAQSAVQSEIQK